MEEIIKAKIEISDEGVIFIDGLTADYEALDNEISKESVEISFTTKNAYDSLYEGYKEYLQKSSSVAEIQKKLDIIKFIFDYQRQIESLKSAVH